MKQRLDSKHCPRPLGAEYSKDFHIAAADQRGSTWTIRQSPWMAILSHYRTVQYTFLHASLMGESLTRYRYVFLRVRHKRSRVAPSIPSRERSFQA
jgi:hypothetical protein